MRWLFLLLLVLNLFYYVWHQQQTPLRVKEVAPLSLHQDVRQGIRLLSEAEKPQVRHPGSEVRPSAAAEPEACLFLGGFEGEDAARAVLQRMTSLDVDAELRSVDAPSGVDYWVYLAPLASRQASLRQLKELQARKIDSYIITQGDLTDGISLGMFPRSESAESVMQRLREAGYEPLMRELARAHRSYWVRVAPESRRLVDNPMLLMLSADFAGLQHQLMPCESVATAP
ncbi:SPOR domain-containing protein [Pseudomonas sp. UL073]|uniref:SPOR domain-containing protein n=1 Tax=Zestomonas insulae TaxID=2809017 RepID=A0ABS2II18_9GAMM|nr:SPOR domain-containing protein [Pseudomonas insulae]MBM7062704.1 SPOR domain-containing protein [Pseudomonas insulae]